MLQTSRTTLKPLQESDAQSLFNYRSLRVVYEYQCWFPDSVQSALQFIREYAYCDNIAKDQWQQLGIYSKADNVLIGDCGFCPQDERSVGIGYTISPEHQGKEFGQEAVAALVQFLVEEKRFNRILAYTDPQNEPSRHLLLKLGFRERERLEKSVLIRGEWKDDLVFELETPGA